MSSEMRQLLEKCQERTVAALERIKERIQGRFTHELRVTSVFYDDIFGGIRCCRLNEVIPVTELNWLYRLVGRFFPGDWLSPIVNVRVEYPVIRVTNDDKRIDAIVAQEMQQLASEIEAKGIVRNL